MASFAMSPRLEAGLRGFLQWLCEAIIGLIPLGAYLLVHEFSNSPLVATCPQQSATPNQPLANCFPVTETASPEICILAVVISGLAILSVVPLGQQNRRITAWTTVLVLLAITALLVGALFYGLFSAYLARDATTVIYSALAVALLSSLCLSLERAILAA